VVRKFLGFGFTHPLIQQWWAFDAHHREDDMPSHVQQLLGEGFDLVTEREWWRQGVLHRENDRPAVLLTSLPPFGKYSCSEMK
jgi:hypothetical protein